MSASAARLYVEDFVRWTEQQSSALRDAARAGTNLPLDWENLAEEVESLGRSQRHELRSRLAVIIEHLMKLEHSPAIDPRTGWMEIISRERLNVEDLLRDSPSLGNELGSMIEYLKPRVARLATARLVWLWRNSEEAPVSQLYRGAGSRRLVPRRCPSPRPSPRGRGEGGHGLAAY